MLINRILVDGREFTAVLRQVKGQFQPREDFVLTTASVKDLASMQAFDRNLRTEECLRNLLSVEWSSTHDGDMAGFDEYFASYEPTDEELAAAQSMVERGMFRGNGLRCQSPETGEDLGYFKPELSASYMIPVFRRLLDKPDPSVALASITPRPF